MISDTYDSCKEVREILNGYKKLVDERDLCSDPLYKNQLRSIFGLGGYILPQLFVGGNHLGGADEIMNIHVSGELKNKLDQLL